MLGNFVTSGPNGTGSQLDGYRQLCAGILLQAARDWWAAQMDAPNNNHLQTLGWLGYEQDAQGAREELIDFFEGEWVDNLCLWVGVPVNRYLEGVKTGPHSFMELLTLLSKGFQGEAES